MVEVEPAVLDRLPMQKGARVRRRERDLDRVRVDFRGKANGFFDRLLGLAGQPEDEGAMDHDAELVAVLREAARDVDAHSLFDVIKDLLVAGFVADEQESQAVVAQYLQSRAR